MTKPLERVPWNVLRDDFLRNWKQGEHTAIIGPTGRGKSTLAFDLLHGRVDKRNGHVVAFGTKRRDETLTRLGWPIIKQWPPDYEHRVGRKVILWPKYGRASSAAKRNKDIFEQALDGITEEGSWCIYFDEIIYVTEQLGLRRSLDELWNTARSNGVTVVASSQGVSWVPRAMMTQQSWVFAFKPTDEDVMKRTAEIMGDKRRFTDELNRLNGHEFIICHTLSSNAYISEIKLRK